MRDWHSMTRGETIKIVFEPGETGWATVVEPPRGKKPALVRIANIPLTDNLNIDDVAEAAPGHKDERLHAGRVLSRAFKYKVGVHYGTPYQENYDRIRAALHSAGCKVESFLPGNCAVACNEEDVAAILDKAGIPVTFPKPQPHLKSITPS